MRPSKLFADLRRRIVAAWIRTRIDREDDRIETLEQLWPAVESALARRARLKTRLFRFESLEECESFMRPIWRAERGRVGLAKHPCPTLSRNLWGQHRATANYAGTEIKLPKWARNDWVILHEMAHCLTPGDRHGPRFVGVLIGLLARHAGVDAYESMARADEMGVKYHVRAIGVVPVRSSAERLAAILPCTVMEAAFELDCTWRQVHGYALQLIRQRRARFFRNRIVEVRT